MLPPYSLFKHGMASVCPFICVRTFYDSDDLDKLQSVLVWHGFFWFCITDRKSDHSFICTQNRNVGDLANFQSSYV